MIQKKYDYNVNQNVLQKYSLDDNGIVDNRYARDYSYLSASSPVRIRQTLNINLNDDRPQFNTFNKYHYGNIQSTKYKGVQRNPPNEQANTHFTTKIANINRQFVKTRQASNIVTNQGTPAIVRNVKKHDCLNKQSPQRQNNYNIKLKIQENRLKQNKQAKQAKQKPRYKIIQYGSEQPSYLFQNPYQKSYNGDKHIVSINQKDIFEKIGRIHNLNEEINCRLQRMMNKIDGI